MFLEHKPRYIEKYMLRSLRAHALVLTRNASCVPFKVSACEQQHFLQLPSSNRFMLLALIVFFLFLVFSVPNLPSTFNSILNYHQKIRSWTKWIHNPSNLFDPPCSPEARPTRRPMQGTHTLEPATARSSCSETRTTPIFF